ncbi:MAG TPA: S4 domain-containing protein, partial [bacterium]|nr:S4 domain-containing protein [bacterium]
MERLIQVEPEEQGKRLDIYLSNVLTDLFSRSQIKKMIDAGAVKVRGGMVSAHYKVKAGEEVHVEILEESDDGS